MKQTNDIPRNVCPVCLTQVENPKCEGIWTGVHKTKGGTSGCGYSATCTTCGAKLRSFPLDEEAEAGQYEWEKEDE